MNARLLALPLSVALCSAACFPGYQAKVITGEPKTEFVKSEKYESTPKADVTTAGNVVTVKVSAEKVCYGSNVTTTSQKRVYERKGVSPYVGIAAGVVSAGLFAFMFSKGICDPTDPDKFGGSQGSCDLITAGGTLVGFSGTLAYGATSVKSLVSKPTEEELAPEQTSVESKEPCGTEPITNVPLLAYLPTDKSLAYAWPDANGQATFDMGSLIDPSVASGKVLIAFATAPDRPIATIEAEQSASLRGETWGAIPAGATSTTGEGMVTRAHFEVSDVNENVRKLTLQVKVKNTSAAPLAARARIASDNPGLNGRTVLFTSIAAGSEDQKELSVELPKAIPDPSRVDILIVNKSGGVIAKVSAKTGPEEAVAPAPVTPTTPVTPPVDTKGTGKGTKKPK